MSLKMETLILEQRVFIIQKFYETQSNVIVRRLFNKKYDTRTSPSETNISRLVKRFEKTGSVHDAKKGRPGRKASVITPVERVRINNVIYLISPNVERVRILYEEQPSTSAQAAQQLEMSIRSLRRIMKDKFSAKAIKVFTSISKEQDSNTIYSRNMKKLREKKETDIKKDFMYLILMTVEKSLSLLFLLIRFKFLLTSF